MTDEDGVPRMVAELCGHKSLPNGGVKFVEASWVAVPAFPGAVRRNTVLDEWQAPPELLDRVSHLSPRVTASKVASPHSLSVLDYSAQAALRSRLKI